MEHATPATSSVLLWQDEKGDAYTFRIAISDAKRLKETGSDILEPEFLKTLFGDTLKLIEIMAELLRPQWTAYGLTYTDFAECLIESEQRYLAAREAFRAGLEDFFRRIGQPAAARLVGVSFEAATKALALMTARVNGPKMEGLLSKALERCGDQFDAVIESEMAKLTNGS